MRPPRVACPPRVRRREPAAAARRERAATGPGRRWRAGHTALGGSRPARAAGARRHRPFRRSSLSPKKRCTRASRFSRSPPTAKSSRPPRSRRFASTFEPLDFVIDPLDGLRPGSPNGRTEGNVFVGGEVKTIKWTAEQFDQAAAGKFPTDAEAGETTLWGDIEKGFAEADLIVEHMSYQQSTVHQPLETRTAMAYWQNGKLYLHGSTQSVSRTVASVAGWVGVPQAMS